MENWSNKQTTMIQSIPNGQKSPYIFYTWINITTEKTDEDFNWTTVTINCDPVENRLKYVTIKIGWDAKQIAIHLGVGVYMNVCLRGTYCLYNAC